MIGEFQVPTFLDPGQKAMVARIDALIPVLDTRLDTPQGLMREHLTAARSYLIGSMPGEYKTTMEMASEILPQIEPSDLRSRLDDLIRQP